MSELKNYRIPVFSCTEKKVLRSLLRDIGKARMETRILELGKTMPDKMYGFSVKFENNRFTLYHQWTGAPTPILDVTEYMGLSEGWILMMKPV